MNNALLKSVVCKTLRRALVWRQTGLFASANGMTKQEIG
jgi:hypothetical protein